MKRFITVAPAATMLRTTAVLLALLSAGGAIAQNVTVKQLNPNTGEYPEAVALSRDGKTLFASMFPGDRLEGFNTSDLSQSFNVALAAPTGIALDSNGDLLVATAPWFRNQVVGGSANPAEQGVWRVTAAGTATKLATLPFDNVLPNAIASDATGNIYVSNLLGNEIYQVTSTGNVSIWAQNALFAGDPSSTPASPSAGFPIGVNGMQIRNSTMYVSVTDYGRILAIPINGDGSAGSVSTYIQSNDLVGIDGFDMDAAGNVYGGNTLFSKIQKATPQGVVTTLAGLNDGLSSSSDVVLDDVNNPTTLYFDNFSIPFPFLTSVNQPGIGHLSLTSASAAPEPGTLGLLGLATPLLGIVLKRRTGKAVDKGPTART